MFNMISKTTLYRQNRIYHFHAMQIPAIIADFDATSGNAIHSLNPLLCAVKIQERVPSRAEQKTAGGCFKRAANE